MDAEDGGIAPQMHFSGASAEGVRAAGAVARRLVHLDLKGAPPSVPYLLQLLPWLARQGATGLLLEWEDMLPFTGRLSCVSAPDAYSAEEVAAILSTARRLGLEVVPLVQTIGHLEFLLKHEQFAEFREDKDNWMDLCPLAMGATELIRELVAQVIELHTESAADAAARGAVPRGGDDDMASEGGAAGGAGAPGDVGALRYVHLGADEVFGFGGCAKCAGAIARDGAPALFLNHVISSGVAECASRGLTPIVWHDMVGTYTPEQLQPLRRVGAEVMVWSYVPRVDDALPDGLWERLGAAGMRVWGASAYKGASVPTAVWVPTARHIANHASWMTDVAPHVPLQGMCLTGWTRFNHTAALCEVLPAGIPSLALCLDVVMQGGVSDVSQLRLKRDLGVTASLESVAQSSADGSAVLVLDFPGAEAYAALAALEILQGYQRRIADNVGLMCPPHTMRRNVPLWRQLAAAACDVALRGEEMRPRLRSALGAVLLPRGVQEVLDCKLGVLCDEMRRVVRDLETLLTVEAAKATVAAAAGLPLPPDAMVAAEAVTGSAVEAAVDMPGTTLAGAVAMNTGLTSVSPVLRAEGEELMGDAVMEAGAGYRGDEAEVAASASIMSPGSPSAASSVAASSIAMSDSIGGAGSSGSAIVGASADVSAAAWFAPIDVASGTAAPMIGSASVATMKADPSSISSASNGMTVVTPMAMTSAALSDEE